MSEEVLERIESRIAHIEGLLHVASQSFKIYKMVRQKNNRKQRNKRYRPATRARIRVTQTMPTSSFKDYIPLLQFTRLILTSLPIANLPNLVHIFDVLFNIIVKPISGVSYKTGAYAIFKLSPASLLYNSPLLAKDSSGSYTFPGYPVSVKWIRLRIINTTQMSERAGRWAAFLIPYREMHDDTHYAKKVEELTFSEVAAMPHSVVKRAHQSIMINYFMRDKSMYCAQPRELRENICLVGIFWDTGSRSDFQSEISAATFNCEIEVSGKCAPYVIFGPQHRVMYPEDNFKN